MAARNVRFHHADGKVNVEPLATFARANGTDMKGARAILDFWIERGWIMRRDDGGLDVKRRMPRQDTETMRRIHNLGHPVPEKFVPDAS